MVPPHDQIMSNKHILRFVESDVQELHENRGLNFKTCTQVAGDILLIPESWGHGVVNLEETLAIATEAAHSLWRVPLNKEILENMPS